VGRDHEGGLERLGHDLDGAGLPQFVHVALVAGARHHRELRSQAAKHAEQADGRGRHQPLLYSPEPSAENRCGVESAAQQGDQP